MTLALGAFGTKKWAMVALSLLTLKALIEPRNLWIAWKGSGNEQLNAMSIFEPNKKIVLDETSDFSPTIASNVDLLRLA